MEEIEIEVLVAGPEHEVYVDTILDTIAEAAKVAALRNRLTRPL